MISAQAHDFASWRAQAGRLMRAEIAPEDVLWPSPTGDLFSMAGADSTVEELAADTKASFTVPRDFYVLAETVACARRDERWALLYRILYRLKHGQAELLQDLVDPDVQLANRLAKSVKIDIHKMHAFVRFKEVEGGNLYVAWHSPEHLITEIAAPFFVRRFGDKAWCIFTPDRSASWDGKALEFGPGIPQSKFLHQDNFDQMWQTYYASIFNPARIKVKAMKAEMSPKYWASLPEASLIDGLIRGAPDRLQKMAAGKKPAAVVPPHQNIVQLKNAASICKACPLYAHATQTVFGEGSPDSQMMVVGEQPGDQEDLGGRPFIGPAGAIFDQALEQAGIDRNTVYVTNAVKHFKWTRQGKRRLHQKPNGTEIHACKPWLEAEMDQIKPRVIMALGATAGTAVLGRLPKVTQERGRLIANANAPVVLSWHPSAILRSQTPTEKDERFQQLVEDLKVAAQVFAK